MSVDLKIPQAEEPVTVKFKLPKDALDAFQLYVRAAQEQAPSADESIVLATLISHNMKKDKAFNTWLKQGKTKIDEKTKAEMKSQKISEYSPKETA